ncbi:tRNA pseudouridine(55) synthase TruB [Rarobacter faecitabidus]|uniref:tRNA pseudouridine synthase B n=1 Tax=Rarobacter faecitabidus TaxID=13243 RepID=A0A542ZWU5_RARFA|nr:tRNA pseudouridine(55) synthase TruB [Rarobacter faecitabidus]TQL64670.1 tRNA pseudouridine synthase B [Rarobacter faecitabidus]
MKTTRIDTRPWGPTENGIVVVDKPQGWTSHDVVGKIRSLAKNRKVGHAGTLDPMATGVLVVGIGKGTKLLQYIVDAPKEYVATIRLGVATVTEDAEGEVTATPGFADTDLTRLRAVAAGFVGDILQVPSAVSAIKVDGRRAYDRVRAGEDVELAARPVRIHAIDIVSAITEVTADGVAVVDVEARIECGAGTYIRALGRDIAAELGTAAHLTALRRTRIGGFAVADARTTAQLEEITERDLALPVQQLAAAAGAVLPVRRLSGDEVTELGFGRAIEASGVPGPVAAIGEDESLVALVQDSKRRGETKAWPLAVLA